MSCLDACDVESKYYVGDIGTKIIVDICSDISVATTTELRVKKPDGTSHVWVATIEDTTHISYLVIAGDFDQAGVYRIQAYIAMPGWAGRGDVAKFKVEQPVV